MNEPKSGISKDAQRVLDIFNVKEHIVDKDLEKLESRLNDRIIDFEKDVKHKLKRIWRKISGKSK